MKAHKLQQIAPMLSSIKKDTGFQVPKHYFNQIEVEVLNTLQKNTLHQVKKNEHFSTPEAYFDTIENVVLTKLKSQLTQKNASEMPVDYFDTIEDTVISKIDLHKKVKKRTLLRYKYVATLAIAASIAFIFILNPFNRSEITFDSLETSDIEQFIHNGFVDVNTITLTAAFPDFDVNQDINNTVLSDEDLVQYLHTENIESLFIEN